MRVLGGPGARARRRGPHRARRAPRPAGPAHDAARAPRRRSSAPCRSPISPTRSGRSTQARRLLARELGHRRRAPRGAAPTLDVPGPARRRAGRGRDRRSTSRRSAAPSTRARARSGCAARSAPGCCGSPRSGASASRPSAPPTSTSRTRARASTAVPQPDARRYDAPGVSAETLAGAVAAHDALAGYGLARRSTRARPRSPRCWPSACADAGEDGGAARRHHARLLGGRRPGGDARPAGRRRASSCATCRARRTCARRSAPGTTRATSSACWPRSEIAAVAASHATSREASSPRARPGRPDRSVVDCCRRTTLIDHRAGLCGQEPDNPASLG